MKKIGASGNTTQTITTQVGKAYNISVWINATDMTAGKSIWDTLDQYDGIGQGQFVIPSDTPVIRVHGQTSSSLPQAEILAARITP